MHAPPLHDAEAMAVWGDALEARGDPRGVLTHLQLALEHRASDRRLREEEARHVALHARALLGPLHTSTSLLTLRWSRGYVVEARVCSQTQAWPQTGPAVLSPPSRLPRVVRQLLTLESTLPLTMLTLEMPWSHFATEQLLLAVDEVARHRRPALAVLGVHYLDFETDDWRQPRALESTSTQLGELYLSTSGQRLLEAVTERLGRVR